MWCSWLSKIKLFDRIFLEFYTTLPAVSYAEVYRENKSVKCMAIPVLNNWEPIHSRSLDAVWNGFANNKAIWVIRTFQSSNLLFDVENGPAK